MNLIDETIIEVENITTKFGDKVIHQDISFNVKRGTILSLIGGSGCGKSTLLREIIGLLQPTSGDVKLFKKSVWKSNADELQKLRNRFGVLFQNSALFSSLTVGENIALPFIEQSDISKDLHEHLVQIRLGLAGLPPETAWKMPSELSGGMKKRVALARALALEPEVLFLDEPTSGLDPISAREFDKLIQTLSESLDLTIFMVTHDLDSIVSISDRVIVLGEGKVLADSSPVEITHIDHPWIKKYFSSRVVT